ncbi:nicotinate-nucleotide adenylyltransferase [Heliophilum fasciatum]|uniref:Probable nicotinate-nucleotide adenylyltransferase n=1 Tax=Heliophilum fasciatum TaxID=35700 RepID=A0A4R2RZD4_9FIRM|nr:nicotinate-nucleotide adenylyltransferase [Heliophilum fasciatum]MCW2277116.1 nicotinate-nucleotide adenylyltransferase [Heliophilum fasciatum]TCP68247.1 nicotinate-nucleotide adenylyltransferase [Heliophilum fasciatum]
MRIGIMGGTFDPIHYGHLVTAEAAAEQFQLDTVLFVPAGQPPHKHARKVTDPWRRYYLTELAIQSNPRFCLSSIEIERSGMSYTIDTVRALQESYGPDADLYFITGADALLEIMTWHRIDELIRSCYFIAAYRPGYDPEELHRAIAEWQGRGGRFHLLEVPALAISSTDIRERRRQNRSIKYLLPEPVEQAIIANGDYQ